MTRFLSRRRWIAVAIGQCVFAIAASLAQAAPVPPTVPGFDRLANEAKSEAAGKGELLLGELNCLKCHQSPENKRVLLRGAPDLSSIGARATPQWIKAYLTDPQAMKPGTPMPNVFHASAPFARDGAVEALTHYLVSLGGPMKPASEPGTKLDIDHGERLFHTIGCVACHAPIKDGQPAATKIPSIPLGDLAHKTTVDQLAAFLLEPHTVRPSGRMPSLNLTEGDARAIAIYLLRAQLESPDNKDAAPMAARGLELSYWEAAVTNAKRETFAKLGPPKATTRVTRISAEIPGARASGWAARFSGSIVIEKEGAYTFTLTSDDGSRLYIDGKQVIDDDGVHPATDQSAKIQLAAGSHAIVVTYFQGGGEAELSLKWAGPGIAEAPVPPEVLATVIAKPMSPLGNEPFTVDPQKVQMGKMMFSALGCAACHDVAGQKPMKAYAPLAQLNVESAEGCLGNQIKKAVPNYYLSDAQRDALKAAIKNAADLSKPLDAKDQVVRGMAAMNCYACHKRDGIGGPAEDRLGYFTMTAEFDMGDEGKLPPMLTGVGAKLKPEAIEKIVCEAKLHIRPVLATRMPRFEKAVAQPLLDAIVGVDGQKGTAATPAFAQDAAKDGRTLFGVKGLGCVNCHGVLGNKSLGMPAPDLTTAAERLRYDWYLKLMHDPNSVNPATRMPAFWAGDAVAIKALGGGTAAGQIGAIYSYVSMGPSMALPAGLQPTGDSELIPVDEPILYRTFMAEVGPRAVLVGYPEHMNVAFDANLVRLATVWRGRFFDTKGMWKDRGGNALGPLGTDVLKLPALPTFATLSDASAAWPKPMPNPDDGKIARNVGGRFKGYFLDKEKRPTFHYVLGEVDIKEQPLPDAQPGSTQLIRKFDLVGSGANLYLLAAAGKTIEAKSFGTYSIDGKWTVRIKGLDDTKPVIRDGDKGEKQLIVPLNLNGKASFELEMVW